jgi:alanine racemase
MPDVLNDRHLAIEAVYTHFATADVSDSPFFDEQRARFGSALETLASLGLSDVRTHAANSAALLRDGRTWCDWVRPGLLLYGIVPPFEIDRGGFASADPPTASLAATPEAPRRSATLTSLRSFADRLELRPALSLTSRIVAVKGLRPGEGTGYGLRWIAHEARSIAIVPAGYADGLDTRLANRASVLVRGRRRPIVGSVCMDMIMIDVTGTDVSPGDEVTLIGRQGDDEITASEMAAAIGTIPWEVVCRLGARIERRYV